MMADNVMLWMYRNAEKATEKKLWISGLFDYKPTRQKDPPIGRGTKKDSEFSSGYAEFEIETLNMLFDDACSQ